MIDPRRSLLVAGCVMFGGFILMELAVGGGMDSPKTPPPGAGDSRIVAPRLAAKPKPDELLAIGLARPLFSQSRRPPDGPQGGPADVGIADKRLAAIVTEPDRRIAIFEVKGAKPMTVTEGDDVSGWRVETIAPEQISMRGPGGTITLQPKLDVSGAAPPGASADNSTAAPARAFPPGPAAAPQATAGAAPKAPSVALRRRNRD